MNVGYSSSTFRSWNIVIKRSSNNSRKMKLDFYLISSDYYYENLLGINLQAVILSEFELISVA